MKPLAILLLSAFASAAANPAAEAARAWRQAHEHSILHEFADLLSLPNLAHDTADIRRNADAIVALLSRRGVATRLLEIPGAPPAVYGVAAHVGALAR